MMELVLPDRTHSVAADLRRAIGPEKVKDDFPTRTAYAVDASIYKVTPQAIVVAESETDIQTVVDYAARTGVPVTPRAAGTNLTGSAIGSGIILDISRLNRILEVNREEKWRSEEHTSELQSHSDLVCRLLLEKKNKKDK